MLTGLLLGIVVVLRAFPETACARWLERQVAELHARLGRLERRHLVFLALMTIIIVVGGEVLAIGGPLDMGLVLLWDVSTYLDIALAAGTLAAVARGRAGWRIVATRLPRMRPRARAPRTRAMPRPERTSANDDDRPAALAA